MMSKRTFISGITAALMILAGQGTPLSAMELASDTCFSRGEAIAAQQGATLVGAEAAEQGGRAVCRIVLLVQGQDGERPRREEIFVDR